jgi:hypothetical protein
MTTQTQFRPVDVARFLEAIRRNDGCWEWLKCCDTAGYGIAYMDCVSYGAHRVSYVIHTGPIPEGLVVRHTCDNPICVNPAHLILGTHADNSQDRADRKRTAVGEANGKSKLTEAEIHSIRALKLRNSIPNRKLAKLFGVTHTTINCILRGDTWNSV